MTTRKVKEDLHFQTEEGGPRGAQLLLLTALHHQASDPVCTTQKQRCMLKGEISGKQALAESIEEQNLASLQ